VCEQRRTHDTLKQQRDEAEARATELEAACKRLTSEGDEKVRHRLDYHMHMRV
jgi:succinylglutamate desuccinylase